MIAMELEAQKASLAREILITNNETMINRMWLLLKGYNPVAYPQKKSQKRQIGFLNGKAKIEFRDDFEMTTEELLSMQ